MVLNKEYKMTRKYIAHVFKIDEDGSEFIFPVNWYGYFSDDPDVFPASISIEAMGMVVIVTGKQIGRAHV